MLPASQSSSRATFEERDKMKCEAPLAELASDDNDNIYVDLVYKPMDMLASVLDKTVTTFCFLRLTLGLEMMYPDLDNIFNEARETIDNIGLKTISDFNLEVMM
jgi:hypothetical protein